MRKLSVFVLMSFCLMMTSCSDSGSTKAGSGSGSGRGVYLLLDTSGTYTRELKKAQQIITQRARSLSLRRAIEDDREVVLAYYELGQADQA